MEFITKIHLGEKKENENYQCIYSSQMYGTFFSIFALVDTSYNDGDDFYTLKGIDLKIINYKGVVNLGIIGAELVDKEFDPDNPNEVTRRLLKIGVKPLLDTPDDVEVDLKSKNLKCNIGSEILVERFLAPMHNDGSTSEANGTFDNELFYREGIYKKDSPILRTGYEIRFWKDRNKPPRNGYVKSIGGWICPFMLLIVI